MDDDTRKILAKTVDYVEQAQTAIDKSAEEHTAFVKRATQAAGVLAAQGVLARDKVDSFIDKVADNPLEVWSLVEKLAASLPSDTLGREVDEKMASGADLDPWERLYFFGDANASALRPGMVD